ncbi:hypothetical protein FB451DRAFT_1155377, partial [Mycena latifolia]
MRPAHQVYSHQLRELSHGYALWCPEPCLYDEVKVGDVGYLRDGAFHRLFNATLPADHPDQTLGVPPLFQPLILPVGSMWRNDKFFDPSNLRSSSVSEHRYGVSAGGVVLPGGAGVHFSCSRKQGALLHLSRPAIREEALAREAFETYTLGNFTNWYDFANTVLLRGVKSGDILFVTGCDKTFEWASAVFDERSVNAGISLKADAVPGVSAELTFSGRWDTTSSIQHRSGPIQEDIEVPRIDQTVFIRGYKILERTIRSPKVIRAAAEPRPPSSNEDQKDFSMSTQRDRSTSEEWEWAVESIPGESQVYHPSDALLEYILDHSDEAVAIVHDDHWCGIATHPALRGDCPPVEDIIKEYDRRFLEDVLLNPVPISEARVAWSQYSAEPKKKAHRTPQEAVQSPSDPYYLSDEFDVGSHSAGGFRPSSLIGREFIEGRHGTSSFFPPRGEPPQQFVAPASLRLPMDAHQQFLGGPQYHYMPHVEEQWSGPSGSPASYDAGTSSKYP